MQVITRQAAIMSGLKRYFTGRMCRRGHVAERQVTNHRCVLCNLQTSLEWAKSNREKRNLWARSSYDKEKDKSRPSRTKEFAAAKQAKRRSLIYSSSGSHSKEDILRILALQGNSCVGCGQDISKSFHVDHIFPISKGGSNGPENIQCLCATCNRSKYNKLPDVWAKENGRLI